MWIAISTQMALLASGRPWPQIEPRQASSNSSPGSSNCSNSRCGRRAGVLSCQ